MAAPSPATPPPDSPVESLVAEALHDWGSRPALEVSAAMADAVDRRTTVMIEGFVAANGPPPSAFAWMALGSHARRELHCASDQDNALVWADDVAARSGYAGELARTVINGLEQFGMRRCSGGYMADRWSLSLSQWEVVLHDRIAAPTTEAVVDADIFLDLRQVTGPLDTSDLHLMLHAARGSDLLLHGLAVAATSFQVPLRVFGRLPRGEIDIKRGAIAPLVLLGRVYGLQAGSTEVSTVGRLDSAVAAGLLSERLGAQLVRGYEVLTRLRLRHQLHQIAQGCPVTDLIPMESIPWADRKHLQRTMRAIRAAQGATAMAYRTDL